MLMAVLAPERSAEKDQLQSDNVSGYVEFKLIEGERASSICEVEAGRTKARAAGESGCSRFCLNDAKR